MKYFIIVLGIIYNLKVNAQLNLPLKLQSDEIKWVELNWIDGAKNNDQWLEMRVPPIILEDTLYTFMNYRQNVIENDFVFGYCGYKIKKINKTTGVKYWETTRIYKEVLNRKIISQPFLQNDKLIVTLFDEASSTGTEWNFCYPAHVVLDLQSGNIIDSNYVDKKDLSLTKHWSIAGVASQNQTGSPRIYYETERYIHRYFQAAEKSYFIDKSLDSKGILIKSDTTYINPKYLLETLRYFEIEDGIIGTIFVSQSNNWANREVIFAKFDTEMKLIEKFDITSNVLDSTKSINLLHYSNGHFILVTGYENFEDKISYLNYHLFNTKGEYLDKLNYQLRDGIDNGIKYGHLYPMVDIVNRRILLTHSRQNKLDESTFYEIFVSDGDTIKRIKRIEVSGIKDHFRTEYATMMENGDILLYMRQFAWDIAGAKWFNWVMLDGQKMNIVSKTKDEIAQNKLKIYPNPTKGIISIDELEGEAIINLRSTNGQLISISKTINNQIDISELSAGIYILEIRNNKIHEYHKIVKVE